MATQKHDHGKNPTASGSKTVGFGNEAPITMGFILRKAIDSKGSTHKPQLNACSFLYLHWPADHFPHSRLLQNRNNREETVRSLKGMHDAYL